MSCITLCVLLCSLGRALLCLEDSDPPPPGDPSADSPVGSVSLVMTHQARALALVTWPVCPVLSVVWERTLPPCLLA